MIRSQEPPGWRRGTWTRTPVLPAERVEVSARSSNRTVGSGSRRRTSPGTGHLLADGLDRLPPGHRLVSRVGQHCLRLVEGRHSRGAASVEPLSDQPCHLLGLYRLRSTGHLTTFSGEGRAAIHLPCRPGPAGARAGVAGGHAARQLVHGMHPPFDPYVASRSRHRLTILRPPAEIRHGLQISPSHSA